MRILLKTYKNTPRYRTGDCSNFFHRRDEIKTQLNILKNKYILTHAKPPGSVSFV